MPRRALACLSAALKRYNRRAARGVRIELRTAVHIGPVATGDTGLTGEALILVARLLDAPLLKQSMTGTGALLGVIASAYVYDSVIRHLDVDGYTQVRCKAKESRLIAWMCLSGQALPPRSPRKVLAEGLSHLVERGPGSEWEPEDEAGAA